MFTIRISQTITGNGTFKKKKGCKLISVQDGLAWLCVGEKWPRSGEKTAENFLPYSAVPNFSGENWDEQFAAVDCVAPRGPGLHRRPSMKLRLLVTPSCRSSQEWCEYRKLIVF